MVLVVLCKEERCMAFFLKKTPGKNRTFLSIVDSHYSSNKKDTAHKVYKSLKSVEYWKANGIDDPIAHFQKEVDRLNAERDINKSKEISDISPKRYLGYFLPKAIMEKLDIKKYIDFFKLSTNYDFDLYNVLASLIYARLIKPCSKYKTYTEVIPYLFENIDYSYDQLLSALSFYGNDYEKIVELFTAQVKKMYSIKIDVTYFDATNFYFEIDKEDELRRKGPSKENRKDPIVGLGLLLDANIIPIGMQIYPGNESEKPIINKTVSSLKTQNNINGRTIRVADKGLNCAKNIYEAILCKDGYIFSKSVKQLPETEITWVLLEKDYVDVKDNNGNVVYRYKECIDEFLYDHVDDNGKKHTFKLKEKRLVTYNPTLAKKKNYEIDRLVEKANSLCLSKAKKDEYGESAKYVNFKSKDGSKATFSINEEKIRKDRQLAGYNLIVTSEVNIKAQELYRIYHNLWHIEESFKIMKSDLDARPAYMKTEETIKGHFLICYLSVLIERIIEFKILENKYNHEKIFDFIRSFEVVKADDKYINITASSELIRFLKDMLSLPLTNYILTDKQLKKILNYKL